MANIKKLLEGYQRFYKKYFVSDDSLYRTLSRSGQSPKTLIISCSDSRVDPSIISDADPGDIFVIRNVANLIPPYEPSDHGLHGVSAALEFAVRILKVENIVVMGHSKCAGVQTLLHPESLESCEFVGQWVHVGQPAKTKAMARCHENNQYSLVHECEKEVILLSLEHLKNFPWIKERVEAGNLSLYGWYFDINDGCLYQYDPQKRLFQTLCEKG